MPICGFRAGNKPRFPAQAKLRHRKSPGAGKKTSLRDLLIPNMTVDVVIGLINETGRFPGIGRALNDFREPGTSPALTPKWLNQHHTMTRTVTMKRTRPISC